MIINASAHRIPLADKSVHSVVTSPPYFGLRKYEGAQDVNWPSGVYAPMTGAPACVEVPAMRCPLGNESTAEWAEDVFELRDDLTEQERLEAVTELIRLGLISF